MHAHLKPLISGCCLAALGSLTLSGCSNMATQALNSEGSAPLSDGSLQPSFRAIPACHCQQSPLGQQLLQFGLGLAQKRQALQQGGRFVASRTLYNQCLEYDPNHAECYRGLAVLLTDTNRQDAAFRLLEGWASRSPQLANPRIELGRLLEGNQQLAASSNATGGSPDDRPRQQPSAHRAGPAARSLRDPAQALANYQRSLEINRFQPAIAARVPALQAATATPISTPTNGTRTVQQWQPNVRY